MYSTIFQNYDLVSLLFRFHVAIIGCVHIVRLAFCSAVQTTRATENVSHACVNACTTTFDHDSEPKGDTLRLPLLSGQMANVCGEKKKEVK